MLGGDPSVKTDYVSLARQSYVDHHASRPQREKRNANESTGFPGPNAQKSIVTELPKNTLSTAVQAERDVVCKESRARTTTGKKSRTASQVDCSIMGAPFKGVSVTASSLANGRDDRALSPLAQRLQFKTDFEPPRHPILHTSLPFVPATYEFPGTTKKCSQNVVHRNQQLQSFLASSRPGKSFVGGVHL